MTATQSNTAAFNRIAGHLPADAAPTVPVPATQRERRDLWQDALAAAMLFFKGRLAHRDADVAGDAAHAIFNLEMTRIRHGREIAGTALPKPAGLTPLDATELRSGDDDGDDGVEEEVEELDPEEELQAECEEILWEVDQGKSVYDRAIPAEEKTAAELFSFTPEYRTVVRCFEKVFYCDRHADLPAREAEKLARELFIRRMRVGKTQGGIIDLRGFQL